MLGEWTTPFTVDASAFEEAFGPFDVTPHEEAIPATVEWFARRGSRAAA